MAAELADILTLRARQCRSVNTLIIKDGVITGDSTDGVGLERALMHNFSLAVKGKNFIFLGAGGAARATAIHFACAGAKRILFVNRTASKAKKALACTLSHVSQDRRVHLRRRLRDDPSDREGDRRKEEVDHK